MPDRPLVSVVTPTLNQANFLQRTLASVQAQTYPFVEHIVVDGGSTDGTLEILASAAASTSLRYVSGPDAGMYDAVNKGLAMASGEVHAYLNSDDVYPPWAVETAMSIFERRRAIDIVYGDGMKVEHETGVQRLRLLPPFDRLRVANYDSLLQPAVFWRRRITERLGGFDASMRYVADLDFWLRAAGGGAAIEQVHEMLAFERLHAGRLSTAQKEAMAVEERAMRSGHAGAAFGGAARERAKVQHLAFQRRLLRRFAVAAVLTRLRLPLGGPWAHVLRDGRVHVSARRLMGAARRNDHGARNAVISGLAAELLGTPLISDRAG